MVEPVPHHKKVALVMGPEIVLQPVMLRQTLVEVGELVVGNKVLVMLVVVMVVLVLLFSNINEQVQT